MIGFCGLYRKYVLNVFRFAFYLSGDRGRAEDIRSGPFDAASVNGLPCSPSSATFSAGGGWEAAADSTAGNRPLAQDSGREKLRGVLIELAEPAEIDPVAHEREVVADHQEGFTGPHMKMPT